jgi:hypothetical protein
MPTNWPAGYDTFTAKTPSISIVTSSDGNNWQDALAAMQQSLGAAHATISDTSTPPAAPANQAEFNDMVAYQLRRLIDGADWKAAPSAAVTQLVNRPYITNGADAVLTGETAIGTAINAGPLGSRPAAASGNTGWVYAVTSGGDATSPNGSWARSNGSSWVTFGFMVYGTLADGDLVFWDDTNKRFTKLGVGSAGQVVGSVAGRPAYFTPSGVMVASPSVFDPVSKTWMSYSTIQGAVDNATTGQVVWGPDAVYGESVTLKDGVLVYMPGSTIHLTATTPTVTGADGGALIVDTIRNTKPNGRCVEHASGTARIVARQVLCAPTAGHSDAIAVDMGAGTLYLTSDRISAITTEVISQAVAVRLQSSSAVLHLTAREVSAVSSGTLLSDAWGLYTQYPGGTIHARCGSISASGSSGGMNAAVRAHLYGTINLYGGVLAGADYDIHNNGATINVHGCQYNPAKVAGEITYLTGDRMRPAQVALFAGSFA